MKHFVLSCMVDEATLGTFMAFALDHSQVLDCSIYGADKPRAEGAEGKGKTRKSRKGIKARSKVTENAVLPLIPPYGDVPIHRKEIQTRLHPRFTANAIDGALSGLVHARQIMRTSPGHYTLVSSDPAMVAPYDKI